MADSVVCPAPSKVSSPANPARRRGLLIAVLAATCGSLVAIVVGFLFFATAAMRMEPSGPRADAIVALTGGPSRISDAVVLLSEGRGGRLLITGVHPGVRERELARVVPRAAGLMHCCIDLDHRALNTLGNALETRRWARSWGFGSVMVVTSHYHMPRTLLELGRLMPGVALVAHPVRSDVVDPENWWRHTRSLRVLAFEYVKYLLARVHLRLDTAVATPHKAASRTVE